TADRAYPLDQPPLRGMRDAAAEQELLDRLEFSEDEAVVLSQQASPTQLPVAEQRLRGMDAVQFAEQVLPGLYDRENFEVEEHGRKPEFREASGDAVVRFASADDVEGRTDWLELEVIVTVADVQIGLAPLLEALTVGQNKILLHDGIYVDLDRPEFDR